MTVLVFNKLLAILLTVAIGWWVGRRRWLDGGSNGQTSARILSNAAFYIFAPALLFRTTARVNFDTLPWPTLVAFFLPVLAQMLGVYAWHRWRRHAAGTPAAPSVRAITVSFGNTLQVGVPVAAAVFGETGLSLHVAVVSLHALTLLTVLTLLVELDLARASALGPDGRRRSPWRMLALTLRNTVIHPVVLPVLGGLIWNSTGFGLPVAVDEILQLLGAAVVPLCLTLIGLSLAAYGWPKSWKGVLSLVLLKLVLQPTLVLIVAHWGFHLHGLPLSVIVLIGALPVGSNALLFAQRYNTLEGETTTALVLSTLLFALTAPLWLHVLGEFR